MGAVSGEDPFRRPFSTWTRRSGRREGYSGSSESGVRSRTKRGHSGAESPGQLVRRTFRSPELTSHLPQRGKPITPQLDANAGCSRPRRRLCQTQSASQLHAHSSLFIDHSCSHVARLSSLPPSLSLSWSCQCQSHSSHLSLLTLLF